MPGLLHLNTRAGGPGTAVGLGPVAANPYTYRQMERIIRKSLLTWVLLLGAQFLTQVLPLPGGARLGLGLGWVIMLTSPVVALFILLLLGLRLRETLYRVRVLRRARYWRRKRAADNSWLDNTWGEV